MDEKKQQNDVIVLLDEDDAEPASSGPASCECCPTTETQTEIGRPQPTAQQKQKRKGDAFGLLMDTSRRKRQAKPDSCAALDKEQENSNETAVSQWIPGTHDRNSGTTLNGLTHLMDKAKEKPFAIYFHLARRPQATNALPPMQGGICGEWMWIMATDKESIPEKTPTWSCQAKAVFPPETSQPQQARIYVSTDVPSGQDSNGGTKSVIQQTQSNGLRFSMSQLKSIMQKAVRRRRVATAVKAASLILHKDENELLRRLPIIVLEDAFLHPGLPVVIWLMIAASKGYSLANIHYDFLLSVVADLAESEWLDRADEPALPETLTARQQMQLYAKYQNTASSSSMLEGEHSECLYLNTDEVFDLSFLLNDLVIAKYGSLGTWVICILIRSSFGGMKGDINMCIDFAHLWMMRFRYTFLSLDEGTSNEQSDSKMLRIIKPLYECCVISPSHDWTYAMYKVYENKGQGCDPCRDTSKILEDMDLKLNEVPIAALDFHCSNLIDILQSSEDEDTKQRLKNAKSYAEAHMNVRNPSMFKDILKRTIWVFSAGVNVRSWVPIYSVELQNDDGIKVVDARQSWRQQEESERRQLLLIWKQIVHPTYAIAKQLIQKRLIKSSSS